MKGPNPFTPYVASPLEIKGRKIEMDMFGGFLNDIASGKNRSLLVSGMRGGGKSEFLRRLQIESERIGFFSPIVNIGMDERFDSFVSKLLSGFLRYAEMSYAENGLSNHALVSLKTQLKEGKEDFFLSFIRSSNRHSEGLIIFIDDADRLKDNEELIAFLSKYRILAQNNHLKLGFVISYTRAYGSLLDFGKQITLHALEEHEIRELVESGLKKGPPKMGEECLRSIIEESGGNPLILKTILQVIYEKLPDKEKVITQGHYLAFYPTIMGTLSRDFFDGLYQSLPGSEKEVLKAFAEEGNAAYVSDIARKIGKRHATTLALRLVERGQLVRVDRGLYRVFTKLYGRYVMQRQG